MKDLFNEYLNSKEFLISLLKLLNDKENSRNKYSKEDIALYYAKYKFTAEHYVELFENKIPKKDSKKFY